MIADLLSRGFHRNRKIIHAQAAGLSHDQSLSQSEYNVNCFNWVLGHLVNSRSQMLVRLFGTEPVMSEEQAARYVRESDPITADGPGVLRFDELLGLLDASQDAIRAAMHAAPEGFFEEEIAVGNGETATRGAQAMFTYFHDTYHTGQTDLLRQMSGMSDKVI